MLNSNRYLLLASTVGIVAVVCLMLLYRQLALSALVEHETQANVALTEVFSNSVWSGYRHVVQGIDKGTPRASGLQPSTLQALDADVKRLMRGSKVVKVKLYDLHGLTLYSSDPSQIGQDKSDNGGFLSARDGVAASEITWRDQFDAFEGRLSNLSVVASYIPIRDRDSNAPEAVFEVYSDVTALNAQMLRTQWQIVVGVLVTMGMVYIFLLTTARRMDHLQRARHEEAAQAEAQIRYQAFHDAVTDLPNRASFQQNLDRAVQHAQREEQQLAVMFLDVDRFKLVNDSFGHDAGDELLRMIAARLRYCVRQSDSLFRMGGDEFTVLVEDLVVPDGAISLAQRIVDAMKEPFMVNQHAVVATISIGISVFPDDDTQAAKLVKNADAAMYRAKDAGRNQFHFYTPELNAHAIQRLAIESALQRALGNNEFSLHFQPRLAADEFTVVGFEALLRWRLPPDRFIPVLEQTGLIGQVGEWVLEQACVQCKAWHDAGYDDVRISVNVSPRQFRERHFVDTVTGALANCGLDAKWLELELTESALLDNPDEAINTMLALKALGVVLSLDDFGTGYSSFSYLKSLPVDYLKIDRSFVNDLDDGSKDAAIITAIAGVARSLDIGLVAEGVEHAAQADFLVRAGCHELQGFLYSKPVPAAVAEQWLHRPEPRLAHAGANV